jgi:hypothetical protein
MSKEAGVISTPLLFTAQLCLFPRSTMRVGAWSSIFPRREGHMPRFRTYEPTLHITCVARLFGASSVYLCSKRMLAVRSQWYHHHDLGSRGISRTLLLSATYIDARSAVITFVSLVVIRIRIYTVVPLLGCARTAYVRHNLTCAYDRHVDLGAGGGRPLCAHPDPFPAAAPFAPAQRHLIRPGASSSAIVVLLPTPLVIYLHHRTTKTSRDGGRVRCHPIRGAAHAVYLHAHALSTLRRI